MSTRHASRWLPETSGVRDAAFPPLPPASRRGWPTRPSPRGWTTAWSISPIRSRRRPVRIVTSKNPEALEVYRHSTAHLLAAAVTALFPGVAVRHRAADRRGLLLRLRRRAPVRAGRPRGIEAKMQELAAQDYVYERQMWPRDEAIDFFKQARRAAQGAADRGEDGRPVARLRLHDQGPRHVRRLLRRPARAVHRQAEGVQADDDVERLLEGRREERSRCSASTARPSSSRRSSTSTSRGSKRPRSATTASWARSSGSSRSTRGRRARAFWPAKGTTLYNTLADYMRGVLFPAGYQEVKTPIVYNKELWDHVGPLVALPREHVPGGVGRRRARWASRR